MDRWGPQKGRALRSKEQGRSDGGWGSGKCTDVTLVGPSVLDRDGSVH